MKPYSATPPDLTGAAMDAPLRPRHGKRVAAAAGGFILALAGIAAAWQLMPRGLQVRAAEIRVAAAERGMFRDDVVVRAQAVPLTSVVLDAVEAGRVEEVFARDGMPVKKGDLLFRLSNPQRQLDFLARQSELAQQISNLSNLRVALEASRAEHRRRLSDLSFNLDQAKRQHARHAGLAEKGFVSTAVLEESVDRLARLHSAYVDEKDAGATDLAIKRDAIKQLEHAITRLAAGLRLVSANLDALAVRAPVTGRLTDFQLQVGETVKAGQHLGRIDDPARFKLAAQIDEFYLNRVAVGRRGSAALDRHHHAVEVARVLPQIKNSRFTVELVFAGTPPAALNPGQGVDVSITLGESTDSLLLPNAGFLAETGGAWVFVLAADGTTAERRTVRIGRRNSRQVEVLAGLAEGEKVIVSNYAAFGRAERLHLVK
ncbi:MAG TPA: efflux RND transporter periplasmic adaptor subunit [Paucimonas sp.]|nr:efflux RND transporter periplasmic adaptor subunit [Paucimonas sp.]